MKTQDCLSTVLKCQRGDGDYWHDEERGGGMIVTVSDCVVVAVVVVVSGRERAGKAWVRLLHNEILKLIEYRRKENSGGRNVASAGKTLLIKSKKGKA